MMSFDDIGPSTLPGKRWVDLGVFSRGSRGNDWAGSLVLGALVRIENNEGASQGGKRLTDDSKRLRHGTRA
jgi:hypothetical protein